LSQHFNRQDLIEAVWQFWVALFVVAIRSFEIETDVSKTTVIESGFVRVDFDLKAPKKFLFTRLRIKVSNRHFSGTSETD